MSKMPAIRVPAGFALHPKLVRLETAVGPGAVVYLVRLWCHVASAEPRRYTGILDPQHTPFFIEAVCGWRGEPGALYRTLRDSGWLDRKATGALEIHQWTEHQFYLATAPRRRARAQAGAAARWKDAPEPEKAPEPKPEEPVKKQEETVQPDPKPKKKRASAAETAPAFHEWVLATWNRMCGPAGFARMKGMTPARRRSVNATVKEFGRVPTAWEAAFTAYIKDAARWPERKAFGFDSFIRPSRRARWFEGVPDTDVDPVNNWNFGDGES